MVIILDLAYYRDFEWQGRLSEEEMIITNTGMQTEMGKIAGALRDVKENKTPLQLKMDQLSKILTWLVIGICAVVFAMQIFRSGSFEAEGILNSFMIAISLAVAAIPEGLPAVVTVAFSRSCSVVISSIYILLISSSGSSSS